MHVLWASNERVDCNEIYVNRIKRNYHIHAIKSFFLSFHTQQFMLMLLLTDDKKIQEKIGAMSLENFRGDFDEQQIDFVIKPITTIFKRLISLWENK